MPAVSSSSSPPSSSRTTATNVGAVIGTNLGVVHQKKREKWETNLQSTRTRNTRGRKGKKHNLDKKHARLQCQAANDDEGDEGVWDEEEDRRSRSERAFNYFTNIHILKWLTKSFKTEEDFLKWANKLMEDILWLVTDLLTVPNKVRAVMNFVKHRYGTLFCKETFEDLCSKFMGAFDTIVGVFEQSSSPFSTLRDLIDRFSEVKECPLFQKLHKFLMYIICTDLLQQVGVSEKFNTRVFEKLSISVKEKLKYKYGLDFVHCILDTILYVCEVGYQSFMLGSLQPFFHSGQKYQMWFDEAIEVKRKSKLLANSELLGFSLNEFFGTLYKCIEEGEAMYAHGKNVKDSDAKIIGSMVSELKLIRDEVCTKTFARKSRQAPFSICVFGGSSVGKSFFTDILCAYFGKLHNLPEGPEYIYTRNANDPFWSGFSTACWGVRLDDIGFMRPDAVNAGDPTLLEMLQVVNNVPFTPNQADLADKGKTPLLARLVVATSNTMNLNAYHYFSCPIAVQRRLPYTIHLEPLEECAVGSMLDPSKLRSPPEGVFPNYWRITVYEVKPKGDDLSKQIGEYQVLHKFECIDEFLAWFGEVTLKFKKYQDHSDRDIAALRKIKICNKCLLSEAACVERSQCLDIQAGDDVGANHDLANVDQDPYTEWVQRVLKRFDNATSAIPESLNNQEFWWVLGYAKITTPVLITVLILLTLLWNIIWQPLLVSIGLLTVMLSRDFSDMRYGRARNLAWLMARVGVPQVKLALSARVRNCGDAFFRHITRGFLVKASAGLLAAAASSMAVYFLLDARRQIDRQEVQSSEDVNEGTKPKPLGVERENVWYNDAYEVTKLDLSEMTTSYKGLPAAQILSKLSSNCVYIRVHGGKCQRAICVSGHCYLINSHGVPEGTFKIDVISALNTEGVTPNLKEILVTPSMVVRDEKKELAMLHLRQLPPRANIEALFCQPTLRGKWKGCYLGRAKTGEFQQRTVDNIYYKSDYSSASIDYSGPVWAGTVTSDTRSGDCGQILLVLTPNGPIILGIHTFGGWGNLALSVVVTQNDVVALREHFVEGHRVHQITVPKMDHKGYEKKLGSLSKKSVFRYIESGTANVYGTFEGFKATPKSLVTDTLMRKAMESRGYTVSYGAPVMRGYVPWRNGAIDSVDPLVGFNSDILDRCRDAFVGDVLRALPLSDLNQIFVYDDFTALNGAAGVRFVDRLKRTTSMGWPYNKSKDHFMLSYEDAVNTDAVIFTEEIRAECTRMESDYRNGLLVAPIFKGNLKDEPRSHAKIETGATRIFAGANGPWSVVVRKYLLAFNRVVQLNPLLFEAAPGTVAQSLEWERIYDYITRHGSGRCVAGDYKAFDKKMGAQMILLAFDIIITICSKAGYTRKDLTVLSGIAEDVAFAFVHFDGDLVRFFGCNPSGHPLTVIINCFVNALYNRYVFYVKATEVMPVGEANQMLRDFKDYVSLLTYGDDVIMNVSPKTPWFNHVTITEVLAGVGITYTMADKESESVPYIDVSEATFLKRKFVWDEDIGAVVAPLDEDSIIKSLMVSVASKSVSAQHQCVSIISSAVREYFFHGKKTFHAMTELLQEIVDECELVAYVENSTFPTYDELRQSFWNASKHLIPDMRPDWDEERILLETGLCCGGASSPTHVDMSGLQLQAEEDVPTCPLCGFAGQPGQTETDLIQQCLEILRWRMDRIYIPDSDSDSNSEAEDPGYCVQCLWEDCPAYLTRGDPWSYTQCWICARCKKIDEVCEVCVDSRYIARMREQSAFDSSSDFSTDGSSSEGDSDSAQLNESEGLE